jgi:predicted Rossmann fold flavoprotein
MIVVIGCGPAGLFAAIAAKDVAPQIPVLVLEKGREVLRKVSISGGGRCNVTHNCHDPRQLAGFYPRGGKALLGPFNRFGPGETEDFFAGCGIPLKTQTDGRMFPASDKATTIVQGLWEAARERGIEIKTRISVEKVTRENDNFLLDLSDGSTVSCQKLLLATGGQTSGPGQGENTASGYSIAASLGHNIVPPVPSLFTFKIDDPMLEALPGVAVTEARVEAILADGSNKPASQVGPVLVTHWGLSGPAILKLSAWGARCFSDCGYQFKIKINWLPHENRQTVDAALRSYADGNGKRMVASAGALDLPKRLWAALTERAGIAPKKKWAELGKKQRAILTETVVASQFDVSGKAAFKDEFVTCGGIDLPEVDFKTMGSRVCPGFHLAGEVLDIDGLTGGFNFQACWTTGRIAGEAMASGIPSPSQSEIK